MNKKFLGLVLTATVVGGYVYYRYHKADIEKRVMEFEDKALGLLLNIQDLHHKKVDPDPYPEADPEEGHVHG